MADLQRLYPAVLQQSEEAHTMPAKIPGRRRSESSKPFRCACFSLWALSPFQLLKILPNFSPSPRKTGDGSAVTEGFVVRGIWGLRRQGAEDKDEVRLKQTCNKSERVGGRRLKGDICSLPSCAENVQFEGGRARNRPEDCNGQAAWRNGDRQIAANARRDCPRRQRKFGILLNAKNSIALGVIVGFGYSWIAFRLRGFVVSEEIM